MKHGALHDPNNRALNEAIDFNGVRAGGAVSTDWFAAWNWRPDGDALANDELSCCCEVADLRMIQGWKAAEGIEWPVPVSLVKLRYSAVAGWNGDEATDLGTIPAQDMLDWQTVPIVADGTWRVKWCTVKLDDINAALRRSPLQLTLGLTPEDEDDPDLWVNAPEGSYSDFHRVVCGAERDGRLICLTYGYQVPVHRARVVAADLLIHVDRPAALRTAGIDWTAVSTNN